MAERRKRNRKGGDEPEITAGGRSPVALVMIGVAAIAILIVGWNMISSLADRTARRPIAIQDTSAENLIRLGVPIEEGSPDTPIILMDFSDYSCPACRTFFAQVKPVVDDFVDRGLVRFQYYDFPVVFNFPNSFVAARAARCAGDQGSYWPFHDQLFRVQSEWSRQSNPVPHFEAYAALIGIDEGEFRSCVRSDRHAETVTANLLLGQQLGVSATPTIMLNTGEGRARFIADWNSPAAVRAILDEAVERLGVVGDAGDADDEPGDEGAS